jgi:hypothetical protein
MLALGKSLKINSNTILNRHSIITSMPNLYPTTNGDQRQGEGHSSPAAILSPFGRVTVALCIHCPFVLGRGGKPRQENLEPNLVLP